MSEQNSVLIDKLFKAGAHYGFSKSRRHPSVKDYLFTNKDGNDIFDLDKQQLLLQMLRRCSKRQVVMGNK